MTNKKFNKLTIIKRFNREGKRRAYLCECECGNQKIVNESDLKSGRVRSCGCMYKDRYKYRSSDEKQRLIDRICCYPGYENKREELSKKTVPTLESKYKMIVWEMDQKALRERGII